MLRYIRAFYKALAITLRGETLPSATERRFPRLFAWQRETNAQLDRVLLTAEKQGYTQKERESLTIRLEGRDLSMETILKGVQFHLTEEYPYLLENLTEHSVTAIYAANLNDRYYVSALANLDTLPAPLAETVQALSHALDSIPPSTDVGNVDSNSSI